MSTVYFDPIVGGDGSTITDDNNPLTGLGAGGHKTRFVPALNNIVNIAKFITDAAKVDMVFDLVDYVTTTNISLVGDNTYSIGSSVLVIGQTYKDENGIYYVTNSDWTRRSDASLSSNFKAGKLVGTKSGDVYVLDVVDNFVLGTSDITFVKSSGQSLGQALQSISNLSPIPSGKILFTSAQDTFSTTDISAVGKSIIARTNSLENDFQAKDTTLSQLSGKPYTNYGVGLLNAPADSLATKSYVDNAVASGGMDLTPYARLDGAAFTGNVTAVTPLTGDNSTKVATTAFVQGAVASSGGGSGGAYAIAKMNINNGVVAHSMGFANVSGITSGFHFTFETEMTDAEYIVNANTNAYIATETGFWAAVPCIVTSMTTQGFNITFGNNNGLMVGDYTLFVGVFR